MQDILTDANLKAMYPLLSPGQRKLYLPFLNLAMAQFSINTERRVSMFNAHLEVESLGLTKFFENLNYSAPRLHEVWPVRFPSAAAAAPYAHNPEKLANKTYGGRLGNTAPGDGWKFRGQGPIQFTGKDVFAAFTKYCNEVLGVHVDFVAEPELICQPEYMFIAAAWFITIYKKGMAKMDAGDISGSTLQVNGGYNGLAERTRNYKDNLRILPDDLRLKSFIAMQNFYDEQRIEDDGSHNQIIGNIPSNDHLAPEEITAQIPDEPTPEPAAPAEPAPDSGTTTKLEINEGGDIKLETNAGDPPPPEKVAVIAKEPRLKYIWHQISGMVVGNSFLDGVFEYWGKIQALGLPSSFWSNLIWFVIAGCLISIIIIVIKDWHDKKQTLKLVDANSTPDNKATIAKAADVDNLKSNGYKIVYQDA